VFYVRCSIDDCQERMLQTGKDSPDYLPSSILSKKIRNFNEHAEKLLPLLRQSVPNKFVELDTSAKSFAHSLQKLSKSVEPTILNLISYAEGSPQQDDTFKAMLETLSNQGYKRIPVTELISLENQRQTPFGRVFMQSVAAGKVIPADEIVRFLRRVVYSGDGHDKYILTEDFPTTIDQVREFEKSCATISAVIYSGTRREGGDGQFNIATH
jgi:hypothetical protein